MSTAQTVYDVQEGKVVEMPAGATPISFAERLESYLETRSHFLQDPAKWGELLDKEYHALNDFMAAALAR